MLIVAPIIIVMAMMAAIVNSDPNVDRRMSLASRRLVQALAYDLATIVDVPAMPSLIGVILAGKTGRRTSVVAALVGAIKGAKLFFVS